MTKSLTTAADAPESVRQLLASYEPVDLVWSEPWCRFTIVVAVLTRGSGEAHQWLDSQLSFEQQLPVRAYVGFQAKHEDSKNEQTEAEKEGNSS